MNGFRLFRFICIAVIVLVLCCAGIGKPLWADAGPSYTLEECLLKTLEYSRDALIAGEGIKISEGRYVEERAAALPQVKAEAHFLRSGDETNRLQGLGTEGNEYFGNINLTQALFTWGQIGAAIKAARYDKAASEMQFKAAQQLAMREAATAFYDLLLTIELEKVARDNVAQKQRHLDEAERRRKLEAATDYDVLSASVALANATPAQIQAENNIRLAKDRLRYYMGVQGDFSVKGGLAVQPREQEPLDMVLAAAREKRPDIASQNSRIDTFRELLTVARAGNKPRLDFKSNVGWVGMSTLEKESPFQAWDAGVYLSMPIFDGFQTKGRVIQAESRISTSRYELDKLLDNIVLDARVARNNAEEAAHIAEGLKATTSQAEKLLQMAETGFRHGVKTKLEVDDAESNVLASRINLLRARRDYINARVRLLWIMGEDLRSALFDPKVSMLTAE
ncbi:MAG: TolC family protein [Syntrophobacter sp.]